MLSARRIVTSQPLRVTVVHCRQLRVTTMNNGPVPVDSSTNKSVNHHSDDDGDSLRKEIHRNTFYYQSTQLYRTSQEVKRLERNLDVSNRLLMKYKEGKTLSEDDKKQQKVLLDAHERKKVNESTSDSK